MENKIFDAYFALWGLVLPITSVLVIPSIQGTTLGYLLALFAIIIVPSVSKVKGQKYLLNIASTSFLFVSFILVSQCSLIFLPPLNFDQLRLVNPNDHSVFLRTTLFTQSLYLLAGVSTFSFIRNFYTSKWDRFIFQGAMLLGIYGIYEVVFYQIFHMNGDFLSNRVFGEGELGSGSLFQTMAVGSFEIQRLKSLTGEPSMFAFTMLPLWIYAVHTQKLVIQSFLLVTLVLSASTTMVVGILVYLVGRLFYAELRGKWNIDILLIALISIVILIALGEGYAAELLNELVFDKISLSNFSGIDRFDSYETSMHFFLNAPVINQLFGIGFGVIRSTDMFSTLLVNTGVLGLIFTTGLFFYPVFKLRNTHRGIGLKLILVIIYLTLMISVSEFSYLTIWLFLGIAYNQLKKSGGNTVAKNNY